MSEVLRGITNKNISAQGYQELPGGLIIQWGSFTGTVTSGAGTTNTPMYQGTQNVTLPKPFPTGVLSITATPRDNVNIVLEYANISGRTLSSFSALLGGIQNQGTVPSTTTLTVDWIAIGY